MATVHLLLNNMIRLYLARLLVLEGTFGKLQMITK